MFGGIFKSGKHTVKIAECVIAFCHLTVYAGNSAMEKSQIAVFIKQIITIECKLQCFNCLCGCKFSFCEHYGCIKPYTVNEILNISLTVIDCFISFKQVRHKLPFGNVTCRFCIFFCGFGIVFTIIMCKAQYLNSAASERVIR